MTCLQGLFIFNGAPCMSFFSFAAYFLKKLGRVVGRLHPKVPLLHSSVPSSVSHSMQRPAEGHSASGRQGCLPEAFQPLAGLWLLPPALLLSSGHWHPSWPGFS